jgi:phosphatidylserine/phosphatidylglycerophosphate/cardiolipin synthase-like enzyme
MNTPSSCLNKFDWITNYGPSFIIPASNFDVIYEPNDFFQELKKLFVDANDRIYISSLYFGTDAEEYELVDIIHIKKREFLNLLFF